MFTAAALKHSLHATIPELQAGRVHVWPVSLAQDASGLVDALAILSADEREHADRFVFEIHRTRYIACRLALRTLLACHLDLDPRDVAFQYSEYGKPDLAPLLAGLPLRFNVSHTEDLALIAITLEHSVGIDVERLRPLDDLESLARTCFSERELQSLQQLPSKQRIAAFFHGWTRKEAFIKACGEGLSHPLSQFDVSLDPAQPAQILAIKGSRKEAENWSLVNLAPAEHFVGAVALPRPRAQVLLMPLLP